MFTLKRDDSFYYMNNNMWKSFSVIAVLLILTLFSIKGIFVAQEIDQDNIPGSKMEFVLIKGGCFEMGDVWEFVEDSYEFDAYEKHVNNNPLISIPDADQVIRGGGWSDAEEDCRTISRARIAVDCPICGRRNDAGFRLVKVQ
jgi:hypothetical protein